MEIEILGPPRLFRMPFNSSTPTILIDSVKVLKPTLILNAKYESIFGRATEAKKLTNAYDIRYLLWWCVSKQGRYHSCTPTSYEVLAATKEFVEWFIGTY